MVTSVLGLIDRAGRRRAQRSGAERWRRTGQSNKSCAARVKRAAHTNEQLATKQFMERHDNVTQGVMDKQDRSSADQYLREVSRLSVG